MNVTNFLRPVISVVTRAVVILKGIVRAVSYTIHACRAQKMAIIKLDEIFRKRQ